MVLSGLDKILNTMSSALSAQSIRMNLTASNLANAGSLGGSSDSVYHSKHPVFKEIQQEISGLNSSDQPLGGVRVTEILESKKQMDWHLDPNNPMADKDGKVYVTDVDPLSEMTDMMAASKEYHAGVEIINTTKNLLLKTIHAMNT